MTVNSEAKSYLAGVYDAAPDEMRDYYDAWAESYDAELDDNGYASPARCAAALAAFLPDRSAPILDFACGTGISGKALAGEGFTTIDGLDVSEGMLAQARAKGVYRDLLKGQPDAPIEVGGRNYAAVAAIGAIGSGAAPAQYIDQIMGLLKPGGIFVLSLNDHTLKDPDFEARLNAAISEGRAEKLMAEGGPHLPAKGLGSRVWAIRMV